MFLLDTNACIQLLNRRHPQLLQHFRQQSPADIALCSIVKSELLYGARRSQNVEANLQLLDRFFAPLQSLPFTDRCAEEAGLIRADLAAQGKPIGPNDLLIAATARAFDTTLVTYNTREFVRITGLRVVDWELANPLLS
ncbi:type II toxin-antitoxin system tRNA(fMet)-specific endonuclease VapC [Synechococcus elongatus]|uniref:Ribonuclease VapC n=1 Tax=Synechococcus elongatus (strain ATCC 33912 / PCC 7942 / FACHB-805) TaxID=1140 RepID=Q79PF1_SYNE7|nr:type II toxin-antitoxin system VapC family toxin [Synechococcus elongatus]AAM82689.1 virulence associated protein C [Synechococcus elongatus PCC 7942 = FACHB-805]ABB57243.1 virulence associated protein C [Synechococcus elongatus PCC 7942 = FACHB-805]AJD58243.1 virulence associated protein C [Synechococcus elongatus UTEX 2973]MBD2587649.1 type II toxin-antitoxin system VapC family toxin [Synechococcus elongatus FACHB-242]MBD2688572.1 type II toxin-antitoxin system VapC family toxin [Synechoc